jgi:hypothetical protein
MSDIIRMAREADLIDETSASDWYVYQLERFAALVADAERTKMEHNNEVLMNALWKACGDDEEVVKATIESQGELK